MASLSSFLGFFEVAAYPASKSAVAGLTRALAVEWAPRGVRVNAVVPRMLADGRSQRQLTVGSV